MAAVVGEGSGESRVLVVRGEELEDVALGEGREEVARVSDWSLVIECGDARLESLWEDDDAAVDAAAESPTDISKAAGRLRLG